MPTAEEQLAQIEAIHKEYVAELAKLTAEERAAVKDFLESVRQKKIAEITNSIQNGE